MFYRTLNKCAQLFRQRFIFVKSVSQRVMLNCLSSKRHRCKQHLSYNRHRLSKSLNALFFFIRQIGFDSLKIIVKSTTRAWFLHDKPILPVLIYCAHEIESTNIHFYQQISTCIASFLIYTKSTCLVWFPAFSGKWSPHTGGASVGEFRVS